MDTAHWPQEIGLVKPMEELMASTTTTGTACNNTRAQLMERRVRPQKEQTLNCPRCNSTNTKFCYYNNYSLTQPRYFCKTCRRYWTEGGSLRNVPVGGGSRKNKRSSSSSTSSSTATATATNNNNSNNNNHTSSSLTTNTSTASSTLSSSTARKLPPELTPPPSISLSSSSQNPKFHEGHDLNLAFSHHSLQQPDQFGDHFTKIESGSSCTNSSAMELLRSGISGRGIGNFMPMPMQMQMPIPDVSPVYPTRFGLQDFRSPTLNFPLDHGMNGGGGDGGGGYGSLHQGVQESSGRMLFPFDQGSRQQVPSPAGANFDQQNRGQGGDPPGFWNGMMGGGGSW